MKIGRNDPCPCGSGKKYKKCHLNSPLPSMFEEDETDYENESVDIFEKYDKTDKLIQFAALQLVPGNHGKNIRLERLIFNAVKSATTDIFLTNEEISEFFETRYTEDYLEDPIDNFFTENIIFFGGNYVVYPGISENGTQILSTFLEGIFTVDKVLPGEFKQKVYTATKFLLEISNTIAMRCGHSRFSAEEDESDNRIAVPSEEIFERLKSAIRFSHSDIEKMALISEISVSSINEFLVKSDGLPKKYDPDNLVLFDRPLHECEDGYIVIMPTGIVITITNYIKSLATEFNCSETLLECYYNWQWKKVVDYAYEMSWKQTSIVLPSTDLDVIEGVFLIDNDKLAYVCLVKTLLNLQAPKNEVFEEFTKREKKNDKYKKRDDEVVAYLNTLNKGGYRYFTLYILGSVGEMFFFSWHKPQTGNQIMTFNFTDFQKIIFAGDLDELSLWKFAKAYSVASEATQFSPLSGTLNTYVMYKENDGSLLPSDDARSDFMLVDLGTATDFGRNANLKRDEHAVPVWYKQAIAHRPVKKHADYAPIYISREFSLVSKLLVESYLCPIWIVNSQAKGLGEKGAVNDFVEAIAFWLFKLTEHIDSYINKLGGDPIEIEIKIDKAFLEGIQTLELEIITENNILFDVNIQDRHIAINIPRSISHLLILEHNAGERLIMKHILNGLDKLLAISGMPIMGNEKIADVIDEAIPLGQAKMILFIDAAKDPRYRNSGLLPRRYIQEVETSFILDNLVTYLNPTTPIPAEIRTPKEKAALCRKVVGALMSQIEHKLREFDSDELLRWLILYNEGYVYHREFREFLIPARIACFSDFPAEVADLITKENKLVGTSLATRCLIEFIAASPQYGTKKVNIDDLDELLALTHEVCQWGVISDTIHFGMSNPQMGLLPSGRIGFSHEFEEDFIKPFRTVRAENEVYDFVSSFEEKMAIDTEKSEVEYTPEVKEVDDAFASEYGIALTKAMYLLRQLINMGISYDESVMVMDEKTLVDEIERNEKELTRSEIISGLQIFSLGKRDAITKPPPGFDNDDISPWRYNRGLSYIRRPLIKLELKEGTIHYYWGFRHVMTAGENLRTLIMIGRLRTKDGTLLDNFVKKINTEKGHSFRRQVWRYMKNDTALRVIDYEVKISRNGHLQAEKDYGDIDILAIDDLLKVIYSIECKNTLSARVPHEMKTEMDNYLGRDGKPGMIQKHVERDRWLHENKTKVVDFIQSTDDYIIKSIVLTSDEIPLIYLAKEKLPLPIISFKSLKRKRIQILNEI